MYWNGVNRSVERLRCCREAIRGDAPVTCRYTLGSHGSAIAIWRWAFALCSLYLVGYTHCIYIGARTRVHSVRTDISGGPLPPDSVIPLPFPISHSPTGGVRELLTHAKRRR